MKVAILGSKERGIVWEKYVRTLSVVQEVVVTASLSSIHSADAVIILDESESNLKHLQDCIKKGYHSYLVSKLPVHSDMIKKIYHTSEEANVSVQFSHWPSFSSSIGWMKKQVPKPDVFQAKRELGSHHPNFTDTDFHHLWIDEIALILTWMGGHTHRIEAKPARLGDKLVAIDISLRMEDGSLASLQLSIAGRTDKHQRLCSNSAMFLDCDVINQKVNQVTLGTGNQLFTKNTTFDSSDTALQSVVRFIKSIQTSSPSAFSAYDLLVTSNVCQQISSHIAKG